MNIGFQEQTTLVQGVAFSGIEKKITGVENLKRINKAELCSCNGSVSVTDSDRGDLVRSPISMNLKVF